jgi:hypothetical protein
MGYDYFFMVIDLEKIVKMDSPIFFHLLMECLRTHPICHCDIPGSKGCDKLHKKDIKTLEGMIKEEIN